MTIVEVIFPIRRAARPNFRAIKASLSAQVTPLYCQGANGNINEVEQATIVSDLLAEKLRERGVEVAGAFHDLTSTDKNQCLDKICDWHNDQSRELDISCILMPVRRPISQLAVRCSG